MRGIASLGVVAALALAAPALAQHELRATARIASVTDLVTDPADDHASSQAAQGIPGPGNYQSNEAVVDSASGLLSIASEISLDGGFADPIQFNAGPRASLPGDWSITYEDSGSYFFTGDLAAETSGGASYTAPSATFLTVPEAQATGVPAACALALVARARTGTRRNQRCRK